MLLLLLLLLLDINDDDDDDWLHTSTMGRTENEVPMRIPTIRGKQNLTISTTVFFVVLLDRCI